MNSNEKNYLKILLEAIEENLMNFLLFLSIIIKKIMKILILILFHI